jgi:hypothetical protein
LFNGRRKDARAFSFRLGLQRFTNGRDIAATILILAHHGNKLSLTLAIKIWKVPHAQKIAAILIDLIPTVKAIVKLSASIGDVSLSGLICSSRKPPYTLRTNQFLSLRATALQNRDDRTLEPIYTCFALCLPGRNQLEPIAMAAKETIINR